MTTNDQAINGLKDALGISKIESELNAFMAEIRSAVANRPKGTVNTRLDDLESLAGTMLAQLDRLSKKLEAYGKDAGEGQKAAWADELKRLEGRVDASHGELKAEIQRIDAELAAVKTTVAGHGTRLDGHDAALTKVSELLETEVRERQMVGESAARANARLDNLRLVPSVAGFFIAAGIAFLTNLIWHNSFEDWNTTWNAFHWVISIVAVGLIGAAIGTTISGDAEASASAWSRVSFGRRAASAAPTPPTPPVAPPAPAPEPARAQN